MKVTPGLGAVLIGYAACLWAAQDKLDGIAAVVGDEVVLCSEIDAYAMLKMNAMNIKPDSFDVKSHRKEFLEDLIDGKVLLVHAKQDTTISVSNDEVEKALDNHIGAIMKQNNWTADSLEAQLKAQGLTLMKFKTETRKAIRDQLLKQKVQQSYVSQIKVSHRDVEEFYRLYADSLPQAGESVLLSKITMKLSPTDSVRQAAFEKIKSIKQRLNTGADFAALARQYSESPDAAEGGDLGFISKGTLSELVFEEKAFSLKRGETSEPFESRLGFHIIQVIDKKDRSVRIRQIFVKVAPPEKQLRAVSALLDSIRSVCKTQESFAKLAERYSVDQATRQHGGLLKWTMLMELPGNTRTAVDSLKAGEISAPVRDDNEISIYRVNDRVPGRKLTLEDNWDLLAEKAKDINSQKKLRDLVRKWREQIYIDVRL